MSCRRTKGGEWFDHFVQFYEDDACLVQLIAFFFVAGLGGGGNAVIIATEAHRHALERRLEEQGIAVEAMKAQGRYLSLDAAETMAKFMRNGYPDEALFHHAVGGLIEGLTRQDRPLRAFGEMVALLAAEGRIGAAIRLEELWNNLGQVRSFALFCAYPMRCLNEKADKVEFDCICREHRRIIPPEACLADEGREGGDMSARTVLCDGVTPEDATMGQRWSENPNAYLAAIVESSDDAIIGKDLNGVITSWNPGATRIFGYSANEAIGRSIKMLIPPDRQNEERQILMRISRGERIEHYETIRRRKDGTTFDISLSISPVRNAQGKIIGASKIARDITARKRIEKALQTAREDLIKANDELERRVEDRTVSLRQAIAQLEEFSYTVSHDLRAPLRGMYIYSQALLEDCAPGLDAEARRCLQRIAANAALLDKMIVDVLTFSRMSRGEIKMGRVSLDKLVRDLIRDYPCLQPPQAEILREPLCEVIGHEPSVTQAVSNLLFNAVKFVAPGVTPLIRIWTQPREGGVRLWVEDNGIGILPEHQHRLFTMFERIHPKLPYEGTGVGLAIVRKAMTRMGGKAGVESDGEHGSKFWLEWPAASPANTSLPVL